MEGACGSNAAWPMLSMGVAKQHEFSFYAAMSMMSQLQLKNRDKFKLPPMPITYATVGLKEGAAQTASLTAARRQEVSKRRQKRLVQRLCSAGSCTGLPARMRNDGRLYICEIVDSK